MAEQVLVARLFGRAESAALSRLDLEAQMTPAEKMAQRLDGNDRGKCPACEEYAYFNKDKFAKLIVRECAEVVTDAVDQREPASTYADKIKQHFGVEE